MKIHIDTTLERDMDLLIIEEFLADCNFADIFVSKICSNEYTVEDVYHSKRDAEYGESDIVIVLNVGGKRHALHIEDKVDAMAMPNQCNRYDDRAKKDISLNQYDSYSVFIVAPEKYLQENKEAKKYPNKVTYEELLNFFKKKEGVRYKYKIALIDRAITDQKNGYQYEADARMVDFCKNLSEFQKQKHPKLPPLSVAWWPECLTFIKGAKIIFKANKGHCDLQFGKTTVDELYDKVKDYLAPYMHIVKANKSASIRIEVTPINFEESFSLHLDNVDSALAALVELYELSSKLSGK